jgi:hypothetical protein
MKLMAEDVDPAGPRVRRRIKAKAALRRLRRGDVEYGVLQPFPALELCGAGIVR